MKLRTVIAAAIGVALLAHAPPSWASQEDAKTFFAEGRRLRLAGQCDAAIDAFERAFDAYPDGLGSLRNIAECEEELGRFASARRHYWDLRVKVMASGASRYAGWVEDAEAGHARLANKVVKLVVEVVGPGADGATVDVNGTALEPALRGEDLERDPGVHQVVARVDGAIADADQVRIDSGERKVVTLNVEAAASDNPAPQPLPYPGNGTGPDRVDDDGPSGMFIGGLTALAVGGAGFIGLGVTIGLRQAALSDLEAACPQYETRVCGPSADGPTSRGQTASTLVNVFAPLAVVATVTGVTLLVIDATSEDAGGPELSLRVGPTSVGVTGTF